MLAGSKDRILAALGEFIREYSLPCRVAIKINLSSLPTVSSPKTDAAFLSDILSFLLDYGCDVTLAEGADGCLRDHVAAIGLERFLSHPHFDLLDTDLEADRVLWVERGGRRYPIPAALETMDLRMAVPCASKRPGYLFSCNVKTFVGLLPRSLCRNGSEAPFTRPFIHEDLAETVSDLYRIICETVPFQLFLNGGNTISDSSPIRQLPQYYCSTDPVQLDAMLVGLLQAPWPPYLTRLTAAEGRADE